MATAHDVAAAVLELTGEVDTFKLQKLVYYSQAWHLVWDDAPLFDNEIEAWANGPVCPDLYRVHRGSYRVSEWPRGDLDQLTKSEAVTVGAVVMAYGRLSGRQLSRLTHEEAPWVEAREGLRPGQRGNSVITQESMAEFYGSLDADDDSESVASIEPWE